MVSSKVISAEEYKVQRTIKLNNEHIISCNRVDGLLLSGVADDLVPWGSVLAEQDIKEMLALGFGWKSISSFFSFYIAKNCLILCAWVSNFP